MTPEDKRRNSEKVLERLLQKKVKELGGKALKFQSYIETGYPDRLVLLPTGYVAWVELKSQGEKPRKIQTLRHIELRQKLKQEVFVIDTREKLDELIAYFSEMIENQI